VRRRIADDRWVTDQADVRCPHCGALLRADSPWCSLCFTDLRPAPEPEPVPEPVDSREPSYAAAGVRSGGLAEGFDPLTAPLAVVEAGGLVNGADAQPATDDDAKPAGWPCTGCAEVVSFDDATCPKCGTAFLAGATGQPDLLDRIGKQGIPASTQAAIIAGGSLGIILLFVGVMYFIGLFL
jgi:RNA polymerase subunit RPABC4/transcription elongation factor Spt4